MLHELIDEWLNNILFVRLTLCYFTYEGVRRSVNGSNHVYDYYITFVVNALLSICVICRFKETVTRYVTISIVLNIDSVRTRRTSELALVICNIVITVLLL